MAQRFSLRREVDRHGRVGEGLFRIGQPAAKVIGAEAVVDVGQIRREDRRDFAPRTVVANEMAFGAERLGVGKDLQRPGGLPLL